MKPLTTLFVVLLFATYAQAQVGVNNANPEQALDVGGKVKLADDATAPTAGTVRYNAGTDDFEGHDGSEWKSFTSPPTLPSGAVPVRSSLVVSVNGDESAEFKDWTGMQTFTTVPTGKFLVITYASAELLNPFVDPAQFRVLLRPFDANGSLVLSLAFYSRTGDLIQRMSESSPLIVLGPGQRLRVANFNQSSGSSRVFVRGFLVDDLQY